MAGHGYYSQLEDPPAPYLRVQVRFPTPGIEGELDFLVDSGADTTALLPDDMEKLGILYRSIAGKQKTASGIGGAAKCKSLFALLAIDDDAVLGGKRQFEMDIDLFARRRGLDRLPSLLGRDVLNQFVCTFDAARGRVTLEGG